MNGSVLFHNSELHYWNCCYLHLLRGWSDTKREGINSQLWYVTEGSAYLRIGEQEYRVSKGNFCLLPETLPVAYGCDRDAEFRLYVVEFTTSFLSDSLFDWIETAWVTSPSAADSGACVELFRDMLGGRLQPHTTAERFQINGDLHTLLGKYFAVAGVGEKQRDDWMSDTLQYIEGHLDVPLRVDTLAARAHMHPNYFIHCFHTQLGMSPAKYIAGVRLRHASALLEAGTAPEVVAEKVGMTDTQQFSRFFKRLSGITPHQYQEKMRNQEDKR